MLHNDEFFLQGGWRNTPQTTLGKNPSGNAKCWARACPSHQADMSVRQDVLNQGIQQGSNREPPSIGSSPPLGDWWHLLLPWGREGLQGHVDVWSRVSWPLSLWALMGLRSPDESTGLDSKQICWKLVEIVCCRTESLHACLWTVFRLGVLIKIYCFFKLSASNSKVHTYVYVCMYVCMYVCIYIYTYLFDPICIYIYIYLYIYIYVVFLDIDMYVYI